MPPGRARQRRAKGPLGFPTNAGKRRAEDARVEEDPGTMGEQEGRREARTTWCREKEGPFGKRKSCGEDEESEGESEGERRRGKGKGERAGTSPGP